MTSVRVYHPFISLRRPPVGSARAEAGSRGSTDRRDEDKTIFVHCVRAENRTPTVAAAYVAERLGVSGKEGLVRVVPLLPHAHPSRTFSDALDRIWPTQQG